MKLGMFYALGGHTNNRVDFQLIPGLLESADNRARFWDGVHDDVMNGAEAIMLHRMYGEPTPGNAQDYDSRAAIHESERSDLTDYAKDMERHLYRFVRDHPGVRVDFYLGSLLCPSMLSRSTAAEPEEGEDMTEAQRDAINEWYRRWWYQLAPIRSMIARGADIRMVFDHAAIYERGFIGTAAIQFLHRIMYPGRVLVEAIPLSGMPLLGLPAVALEDRFQLTLDIDPEAIEQTPSIGRIVNGHTDRSLLHVLDECVASYHDIYVAPAKLNEANITIRDVAERINSQPHPET